MNIRTTGLLFRHFQVSYRLKMMSRLYECSLSLFLEVADNEYDLISSTLIMSILWRPYYGIVAAGDILAAKS